MKRALRISALILAIILALPFIPAPIEANAAEKVVYVSDSGNDSNSGETASTALASLTSAFSALGSDGGTVVICGKVEITATVTTCSGAVTITSVYGGVDYRKSGASLTCYKGITMAGALKLEKLNIISNTKSTTYFYPYNSISMKGFPLHIGKEVECTLGGQCKTYLSITGGGGNQQLTVESGHWQRVRGNDAKGSTTSRSSSTINISGGTFHEKLILTGELNKANTVQAIYCDVNVTINGGEFFGGIYLTAFEKDGTFQISPSFTGDVNITVNGGSIYGPLSASYRRLGTLHGNYTLNLNGGELHRITEICGPSAVGGDMLGTLNFGPEVNPSAIVQGSEIFDFCLTDGADPFVFYHDGLYYMTTTGGTAIGLSCAASLSDLGNAAKTTIFKAPSTYKNAWSPEIHHFTDEEIGEGYGGWYMFIGLANTADEDHSGQREYVLKCLDGDYLLGRWGNPLTGSVNEPLMIEFTYSNEQGTNYNDIFCAGMSILRIDGNVYMTFVSEVDRGNSNFHQTINIVEFETPWNITGEPVEICKSTYDWEMHGYASATQSDGTVKWWPKVVEGCSPVYGDDGSVYLMYTGSGYWTTWYALGYMKYTGTDPLNASSWTKNPSPILQRKSTLTANTVNGCGHGSYFTDANGKMWVCYHGYIGTNTSSGRFAFLEPIYVSESGVSIGGEGINPPDKGATQTEPLNYLPIDKRVSGFESINSELRSPRFAGASITIENSIAINFKVSCTDTSYSDLRVEFEANGSKNTVKNGIADGKLTVFSYKNLTPAMIGDTVKATLYATYGNEEYVLDCVEYSVAQYCYNLLSDSTYSQNTALRTLLVDLLNYGAEAQLYADANTDSLVNSKLTDTQQAWATPDSEFVSCLNFSAEPDNVKAEWKSASLNLKDTVRVQLKFEAESVDGLSVRIKMGERIWNIPSDSFIYENGRYTVFFGSLNAAQLSEPIEATVYEGEAAVSATLTYSVETYACNMQGNEAHAQLVKAMMKYGYAAKAYVEATE